MHKMSCFALAALSLVASFAAPTSASLAATVPASEGRADRVRVLRMGAAGPDVRRLQGVLRELGYTVSPDGRFGGQTRRAVLELERLTQIPAPDGAVTAREGREHAALASGAFATSIALGARSLHRGQAGADVRALQLALARLGWPVRTDGIYGPATERAVRSIQSRLGAVPDGHVPRTLATDIANLTPTQATTSAYSPPATVTGEPGGTVAR